MLNINCKVSLRAKRQKAYSKNNTMLFIFPKTFKISIKRKNSSYIFGVFVFPDEKLLGGARSPTMPAPSCRCLLLPLFSWSLWKRKKEMGNNECYYNIMKYLSGLRLPLRIHVVTDKTVFPV